MAAIAAKARKNDAKEEIVDLLRHELLALFPGQQRPPSPPAARASCCWSGSTAAARPPPPPSWPRYFQERGRRVLLAAADTFRAAGSTQLSLWGEKLGIPVIGGERGADPGSVVYNAMQSWQSRDFDLLVIDTAGRMQSKENLMRELEKITKIIKKFDPGQPAETWLVLDASTGQNALVQAEKFREFSGINGLVLAKLDGTAKGGAVVSIGAQMKLPVLFVGHGETAGDLLEFDAGEFVDSLLGQ